MLVNYDEIIDIIKKDKDINFVAFLRTPWHAQGVEATLESLAESESLNGIILLSNGDYNCDKPLVAKESFNLSPSIKYNIMYSKDIEFPKSKIQLLKLKLNTFSYFMHHKKGTRKIYVLSPFAINDIFVAKLKASIANASIINIIIDEGLGTYTRTKFNWAVEHYQNTKSVKRFVASLFAKNIEQLYKNICSRKNELIINNILVKGENKKYIPNNKIISYYKNSLNSAKLNESEYRQ
jgi:hypothetical protein